MPLTGLRKVCQREEQSSLRFPWPFTKAPRPKVLSTLPATNPLPWSPNPQSLPQITGCGAGWWGGDRRCCLAQGSWVSVRLCLCVASPGSTTQRGPESGSTQLSPRLAVLSTVSIRAHWERPPPETPGARGPCTLEEEWPWEGLIFGGGFQRRGLPDN